MKGSVKTYIIVGVLMLCLAVLVVVVVFFMLQQEFKRDAAQNTPASTTTTDATNTTQELDTAGTNSPTTGTKPKDIPLRDLPLTDGQREVAQTFGIDIDTFVITPDMQYCAKQKLGEERFNAIVGGDAPSLSEGTSLLLCL